MYCKFCQMWIDSYYLHAYKNKTHTANLIKNYDMVIKKQYGKKPIQYCSS